MRVGTRPDKRLAFAVCEDHPHACGDKDGKNTTCTNMTGSSPCVWGQEPKSTADGTGAGIIPMRVGTSERLIFLRTKLKDHPHACGDKFESR